MKAAPDTIPLAQSASHIPGETKFALLASSGVLGILVANLGQHRPVRRLQVSMLAA